MKDLAYKKLETEISRRIQAGEYQPGAQLPTEKELVEEFNVSRMTVVKGLSGLIQTGAIERVRGRGTFVRWPEASKSDSGEGAKLIKCIFPGQVSQQAFSSNGLLEGICETFKNTDYHVGISFYGTIPEAVAMLRQAESSGCAGYVCWPVLDTDFCDELNGLAQRGFPLVLVDSLCREFEGDFVGTDNFFGAEMMMDHLYATGHRRIAYLTIPPDRNSLAERLAGVIASCSRLNIEMSRGSLGIIPNVPNILPERAGEKQHEFIASWVNDCLNLPQSERPTVIFASNDMVAVAVMEHLQRMGVRIPQDISVVAFDNIDRGAWLPVPLTTVAHDFRTIGRLAGRLFTEKHYAGDIASASRQYRVRPTLVLRESLASL